jgi:8-amino-7-oxononanoate synthase
LLDAGLLSGARFNRYLHNDAASLAKRLEKATGNTLVVTDGVFSMDGDIADCRRWPGQGPWRLADGR